MDARFSHESHAILIHGKERHIRAFSPVSTKGRSGTAGWEPQTQAHWAPKAAQPNGLRVSGDLPASRGCSLLGTGCREGPPAGALGSVPSSLSHTPGQLWDDRDQKRSRLRTYHEPVRHLHTRQFPPVTMRGWDDEKLPICPYNQRQCHPSKLNTL